MSTPPRHVDVQGIRLPTILYGTAWKEERTEPLVRQALASGFRGIDTANQRKHYHEAGVGNAVKAALADGQLRREELFLQTKFTYVRGQDHRLPYDADAPAATQVAQSFESSLGHLGVDTLDAYLLHGPSTYPGLGELDHETWRAMEALHRSGRVGLLGVSNVTLRQLEELHERADVKPGIVQNRTFTRPDADGDVRAFCAEHGIAYEGFSLLTAIPHVLEHDTLAKIAAKHDRTPAEIVLRYCLARDVVVLTGTTSHEHMAQDLSTYDLDLSDAEMAEVEKLIL